MTPGLASAAGITCFALPVSLFLQPSLASLLASVAAGAVGAALGLLLAGRPALRDAAGLLRQGMR
jgi:hypothetical protein